MAEDQLQSGQTLQILTQNYKKQCDQIIDFQKAKIIDDNNENVANYRHLIGDQKYMIKNRGLMKDVNKFRYDEAQTERQRDIRMSKQYEPMAEDSLDDERFPMITNISNDS